MATNMRKLMLWNGSWKYNNILFYSCLHFLNRFNKFVNIFFIYVWIWYKYDNILFYSCLYFLNRFNKFVNIFFIHVWIRYKYHNILFYSCLYFWTNSTNLLTYFLFMSEYGIIVNNFRPRTIFVHTFFLPRAKKHSDLCAFKFLLWTPVYRCNLIIWIVI